jgi:adenosylcobinamide-GDP ribazoletransferase
VAPSRFPPADGTEPAAVTGGAGGAGQAAAAQAPADARAGAELRAASGRARNVIWEAAGALGLLSVLPLPRRAHRLPTAVTLGAFAPAGLLLGAALAGLEVALAPVLPVAARSAVLLAVLAVLSGAMHLDGLMDSADGLFGAREPGRRLEIMRDSRVGAYGIAAALCVVLVQYAALSAVSASARTLGLIAAAGISRAASALALGIARPARPDGLGSVFSVPHRLEGGAAAMGVATVAGVALAGWRGVAAAGVAAAVAVVVVALFRRRVGGMSGDGFGAVVELSFAGALLCLAAHP